MLLQALTLVFFTHFGSCFGQLPFPALACFSLPFTALSYPFRAPCHTFLPYLTLTVSPRTCPSLPFRALAYLCLPLAAISCASLLCCYLALTFHFFASTHLPLSTLCPPCPMCRAVPRPARACLDLPCPALASASCHSLAFSALLYSDLLSPYHNRTLYYTPFPYLASIS